VGVLGSARATNEDNYAIQKFARAVLGTNNVDCCARVCHAPSAVALREMFGTGAATSAFDDLELARTIFVCGSNSTENHPVIGARIKQAVLHGAKLVVIDPRRIELARHATVHLQPRPGTSVPLLNAIAATIIEEGLVDDAFLRERVEGYEAFESFIAAFAPERVAGVTGVQPALVREAARAYATGSPSIAFHGLGITEQIQGTEGVMCIANLALLTGNVGTPGTGVNPLRGQNNVQGAAHMGCEPSHLAGYVPLADGAGRFEEVWGARVPRERGLDTMQMLDAATDGRLRALLVAGWDLLSTQPDKNETRRALASLESLVVVDLFLTETARELASVFLPAAAAFEKEGTFMNSERRVQRVRPAVEPPGDARADWEIIRLLATELGRPELFEFDDARAIWDEIRQVWAPGAGITNERLDEPGGVQWPCPTEGHPGTVRLHGESFGALGPRARLCCIEYVPSSEAADDDRPFLLVTGRCLEAFNAGTMTARSATSALRPTDLLEMAPADAARLGLDDGDRARVTSRHGVTALRVAVSEGVLPGSLFATFHDPSVEVNLLTGSGRDPYTNTPEYKVTAVRVEPLPGMEA
jgi:formate dehydrogenase major subunit